MSTAFSPVSPDYDLLFSNEKEKEKSNVIFFGDEETLEEAAGKIMGIIKNNINEEYLVFDDGEQVRIDRIITINGKPGPAYDEYNNYSISCHLCIGGEEILRQYS